MRFTLTAVAGVLLVALLLSVSTHSIAGDEQSDLNGVAAILEPAKQVIFSRDQPVAGFSLSTLTKEQARQVSPAHLYEITEVTSEYAILRVKDATSFHVQKMEKVIPIHAIAEIVRYE